MAFPDDLADVVAFKIHPAIGVARLANNDDYYEFFEHEKKRKAGQAKYMTVRNGKHWIMRQAVRFKIFAYRADGSELGELTEAVMGRLALRATWTASVANRKLNVWSNGATPVVAAQASATAGETKRLEGDNPWRQGKVWLGDIAGNGLFIPPKGGVYRKTESHVILPYGNHEKDNGVLDTTSDGSISVSLAGTGLPIVPACVIVAPQDHSPDVGPGQINNATNWDFVNQTRNLLNIPGNATLVGVGYDMDVAMMNTINGQYNPGMEICLRQGRKSLPDPTIAFYSRGQQHIDKNEIRPSYEAGHAKHGQLTAGLCSTWQTDLDACLDYWTSTYPHNVEFSQNPTTRPLSRKVFAAVDPMTDNEDLNAYIDMMEIARDANNNPRRLRGTERDDNDNAGNTPVAPFPLDP